MSGEAVALSVVIPCLNEADTLGECIRKAFEGAKACGVSVEVIVADNGSLDGSPAIAMEAGARVIAVPARGYGNALMAGIAAARGHYVIMGDADESYDFLEIPKFVAQLKAGAELVLGCRLPGGGGRIMPGAMPVSHRYVGNPLFSFLARWWFGSPIHDVYCGLRGFSRNLFDRLNLRCTGMEFAVEMIIKAALARSRIAEVPITLHRDGRKTHAPHLRTFRDGWRTLRFFLLFSPRWLFLVPGALLLLAAALGYGIALPGLTIGGISFDAHTLLFASMFALCGYQSILFAVLSKTFAVNAGLLPADPHFIRFFKFATLERGLVLAGLAMVTGIFLLLLAINQWRVRDFGSLDYAQTMRLVVPGATLTVLSFQTVLSSFFVSVLSLDHRR